MHIGWLCAALSALTLLPPAALAAVPDPSLRRSEQIDVSRIGKVSEDERSVLRVEWRAAVTSAEEARSVQAMLDSVRRMEGTIGEIKRLIASIPAQKPVVAAVAAESPDSDGYDLRIVAANIVAACLVALWWFRRRTSVSPSGPTAIVKSAPAPSPPLEAAPTAFPSAFATVAEVAPTNAPPAEVATGESSAGQPKPVALTEEKPGNETPRTEAPAKEAGAASAPTIKTDAAPTAPPEQADGTPSIPSPVADSHVIDFMLEDAEPEVVARENTRLKKLEEMDRRKDPERKQASNVDPTLELAEIMLSLGLEQGAAKALVDYTEANPRQALHHWLKLLDIYRKSGNQDDFREATEKLRRNFNIQADDWAKANTAEAPTLENFSRLSEQVQQTWSRPEECLAFLQNLLEDNRDGSRAGFPRPVAEEILLLIDVLKAESGAGQTAAT